MKFIKFLTFFFLIFLSFSNAMAKDTNVSIIDLDSSNSSLLKIYLDKDVETNTLDIESDIKLFRDLNIKSVVRDLENDKLITINLSEDLSKNSSYSLLPVFWAEWSIDFDIEDLINWLEITWSNWDWISKIDIVDSKTIKVTFTKILTSESIDIKLLKEYDIDSIQLNDTNNKELDLFLKDKLLDNSKYIVMMFSFNTKENNIFNIDNSIYDFITEWLSNNPVKKIKEDVISDDKKTDNIALNSAQTPDTWPETWILLFFAFLVSNFIYFRRKFIKK